MTASIAPVAAGDYASLAAFLAGFPGELRTEHFWLDRLAFWWDRNPAANDTSVRGWVLTDRSAIVGFIGVVPTLFQLAGEPARVFSATTWRVLPQYRSLSMPLLAKQLRVARESVLFATTSIARTRHIRSAFGFQPLPRPSEARNIALMNGRAVLARMLRNVVGGEAMAAAVGPLIPRQNPLRGGRSAPGNIEIAILARADGEFDELWSRTKALYRNTNVRTSDWINWYCFRCQDLSKTLIAARREGRLVGYAIWRARAHDANGLQNLECLDLWAERQPRGIVAALTLAAFEHAEAVSAHVVTVPHFDPWIGNELQPLGMWNAAATERQDYFRIHSRLASELTVSNSYFVAAQGDNGL